MLISQQEECGVRLRGHSSMYVFSTLSLCHINQRSCPSYTTCMSYEKENKNRVLQLEIGLFIRLIFTTTGAMCNIRTRLSMEIMRSVLVAVSFVCGKAKKVWTAPISIVFFNLIPDEKSF